MAEVRIGFIGAGGIASRHIGNLLNFADVKIIAVADPVAERAGAQAQRCAAQAYSDYREMLAAAPLDALYICVPPFAHGALEMAAVAAKLPFFVEKPLAADWPTAAAIAQQVAEQQLITAVGYHWRYLDTTEEAQALLSTTPARLALGYWLDFTPPPVWWRHQHESGGQMVEQTTHIFDLARLLVGEVNAVYACGSHTQRPHLADADVLDVSTATLHFASGAVGTMHSTCLLTWPHRIGLQLYGEDLAIELSERELFVQRGQEKQQRPAQGDPFIREDRDFIDAVQGKTNRIRSPYAAALKTHQLTTAANQSAREGRIIHLAAEAGENHE